MCLLEWSAQYCRALQMTYVDYDMDYRERFLSSTWHQAWPLIKKQTLDPSSGLCTSKRNRVKETFLQWAGQHLLWAGIKPGLDFQDEEGMFPGPESSLLWDPREITETSCWERTGRGQGPEEPRERGGWSRLVPPKDAFELGNKGGRKEAGCPGIHG